MNQQSTSRAARIDRFVRFAGALAATATLALVVPSFANPASAKGILIGVIFPSQNQVRWAWERKFFSEEAAANGDDAIFQFSNESVATQKNQVETLIQRGVKVLVMAAIDAKAASELVIEAQDQGIKVVMYDRGVTGATPDYAIQRNNYEAGKLQAEAALASKPSGSYAIIRGDPSTIAQVDMSRAYDELLKNKADIKIVYDSLTPGWDTALAQREAEAALQKTKDIAAFAVQWDDASQSVVQALKSAGKQPGEVFVSGLDSATPSLVYIAQGWQTQTIWTRIDQMAKDAADVAHALGSGMPPLPASTSVDGVPTRYASLVSITKNNLCEFVTKIAPKGWVSKQEVFGAGDTTCE